MLKIRSTWVLSFSLRKAKMHQIRSAWLAPIALGEAKVQKIYNTIYNTTLSPRLNSSAAKR